MNDLAEQQSWTAVACRHSIFSALQPDANTQLHSHTASSTFGSGTPLHRSEPLVTVKGRTPNESLGDSSGRDVSLIESIKRRARSVRHKDIRRRMAIELIKQRRRNNTKSRIRIGVVGKALRESSFQ